MRKGIFFFLLNLIHLNLIFGQVGINTDTPTSTLDVVGDVLINDKLYLEDPDAFSVIQNSKLLVKSTSNTILRYDINVSKYGPVNYSQFVFTNLSTNGLQDYDTKIPINDYLVTISGYYYYKAETTDTNVVLNSLTSPDNIEGYQIYAYKNLVEGTWFLKAFVNNSQFQVEDDANLNLFNNPIDLYLNLIIYRDRFITKDKSTIVVSMGNSETATAPLPAGF
jgi:hypothetical protein